MARFRTIFLAITITTIFASGVASASTTDCVSGDKVWSFKQQLSDGGAPPPAGFSDPHWYLNEVEQFPSALTFSWVDGSRIDLSDSATADADYRLQKYAQDVVIKAPSGNGPAPVTMYCDYLYYIGPPRPTPPPQPAQ